MSSCHWCTPCTWGRTATFAHCWRPTYRPSCLGCRYIWASTPPCVRACVWLQVTEGIIQAKWNSFGYRFMLLLLLDHCVYLGLFIVYMFLLNSYYNHGSSGSSSMTNTTSSATAAFPDFNGTSFPGFLTVDTLVGGGFENLTVMSGFFEGNLSSPGAGLVQAAAGAGPAAVGRRLLVAEEAVTLCASTLGGWQ